MSVSQNIREFLDSHQVPYECVPHSQAFAAQEVAETLHVPGRRFAKAIVLNADGRMLMAVVPATHRLELHELKDKLGAKELELLPEGELAKICTDCELGAFPPFGHLYGMDMWVDKSLTESEEITFNAGSHTEAIRMKSADFLRLATPHMARFAERVAA